MGSAHQLWLVLRQLRLCAYARYRHTVDGDHVKAIFGGLQWGYLCPKASPCLLSVSPSQVEACVSVNRTCSWRRDQCALRLDETYEDQNVSGLKPTTNGGWPGPTLPYLAQKICTSGY